MEYDQLRRIGHDFDDVNPYGWPGFRTLIRFFTVAIRWLLVFLHQQLGLAYGIALIIFGVLVRLLLWPLNQKAMRSSMQMQAIQPHMKELQDRHKDDPTRLQTEMMKLYKEHGVNPFGGCSPLLLPMPILLALFFVFQNTMELSRGASFLWLPDLSRADPVLHHSPPDGSHDVRGEPGGPDRNGADPTDAKHAVHHAGHDDRAVRQLHVGAEPVLRGSEHYQHSATVGSGQRANEAAATAAGGFPAKGSKAKAKSEK